MQEVAPELESHWQNKDQSRIETAVLNAPQIWNVERISGLMKK